MNTHATSGLPLPLQMDSSNAIPMDTVATTMATATVTTATLAQDVKHETELQMYTEVIVNDATDAIETTNQQTGTEQFIIFAIPSQSDENVLQQPIMFQY